MKRIGFTPITFAFIIVALIHGGNSYIVIRKIPIDSGGHSLYVIPGCEQSK